MKILVVEDDKNLALRIKDSLSLKDYNAQVCFTFQQALCEIKGGYDCFLIDVRLPDGSGFDLCRYIREFSSHPIIFISSDTSETSILKSYALDADDYIEKPFRLSVLLAKVERSLKRVGLLQPFLILNNHKLDMINHILICPDIIIELRPSELVILKELFINYPNVVSKERLLLAVYDETGHEMSAATLSVRISELKKKMKDNSKHILAKRYLGYQWR